MYRFHASQWAPAQPLEYPDDGLNGGGGGGNLPAGNQPDPNTPAALKLTDDSLVDFGDGKPVKWKDARTTRYMERGEYDTGVQKIEQGRQFLVGEAKKLEAAWQRYEDGKGAKPKDARPDVDLLEQVASMPVVDGATIRKLYQEGFGPMAQLITQQQAKLTELSNTVGRLGKTAQQVDGDYNERQFANHITKHLSAISEVPGFNGKLSDYANDPTIREIARDVWASYDQSTWTDTSFQAEIAKRISGMISLVRKADKAFTEARKDEKRQRFFNPARGNGNPNGEPQYVHQSGRQIAAEMFATRASNDA